MADLDRPGRPSLSLPLCGNQHESYGLASIYLDVRDWKTGTEVASDDFSFKVPAGAQKLKPGEIPDIDELPSQFAPK